MNWLDRKELTWQFLQVIRREKPGNRTGIAIYSRVCDLDFFIDAYTCKARDLQVAAKYRVNDPDECGPFAAEASVLIYLEILLGALERKLIKIKIDDLKPIGIRNLLCSIDYHTWIGAPGEECDEIYKLTFPVAITKKGREFFIREQQRVKLEAARQIGLSQ